MGSQYRNGKTHCLEGGGGFMKFYCVVYVIDGIHYRYRCYASNKREARKMCVEDMLVKRKDIVDIYEE